ncbi:MAG: hypothetical protein NZ703_09350, partial [Gemmataceae bacterium]|nr:hypothetical protein [Gemmataceae bacterium]
MAQSLITIYKLLGQNSVKRYFTELASCATILQSLDSEKVGTRLIFRTTHYDPTTIAVLDILQHRFSRLFKMLRVKRFRDEDFDILTVMVPASELADIIKETHYDESNIHEVNFLCYIFS